MLSPRERKTRDRRDSKSDESEGQGRMIKMNESEGTDEIRHSPSSHTCCKDSRPCPTVSQYQLDALVTQDTRQICLTQPHPAFHLIFMRRDSASLCGEELIEKKTRNIPNIMNVAKDEH